MIMQDTYIDVQIDKNTNDFPSTQQYRNEKELDLNIKETATEITNEFDKDDDNVDKDLEDAEEQEDDTTEDNDDDNDDDDEDDDEENEYEDDDEDEEEDEYNDDDLDDEEENDGEEYNDALEEKNLAITTTSITTEKSEMEEQTTERITTTENIITTENVTPKDENTEESTTENIETTTENVEENKNDDIVLSIQEIPEHSPLVPEFPESINSQILPFRTTIISSIDYATKTMNVTVLRTYTLVVTQVADYQETVISTTEIRPQIKTTTVTESATSFTTLTLLNLDNVNKITDVQSTSLSTLEYNPSSLSIPNLKELEDSEPRNLATRVMSNGVEVIVAGDKTTYPGDKELKRVPPSIQKPVTLKPSTLTDHMLMLLPQETTAADNQLDPNQFVVKTCLTTFTYLTTYLEKGTTTVSSHEQIISNVATEERMNTGKILPTPAVGITLTQYPNLSVGVFHTTYTYLNTILDGEQPLVISSQHIVSNTVTAPDDYLALLRPSQITDVVKDTNTYYSTINLEKTLYENGQESVISTKEVVTQVVITESIPSRERPVMTSYIALDTTKPLENRLVEPTSTTEVTKTYYVTYTYYNTILENGIPTVYTNISTESDIVTEKVLLQPKKTLTYDINSQRIEANQENPLPKFDILATRVYYTTFTYLTTLLKEKDPQQSTIINSSTKIEQNIVTETLDPNLFDDQVLLSLANDVKHGSGSVSRVASLRDGQIVDITLISNEQYNDIKPTQVLPIEKTEMPYVEAGLESSTSAILEGSFSSTTPSVITGSTIVFIDDDPFANLIPTPILSTTNLNISPSSASQVVKETNIDVVTSKVKRTGHKTKNKTKVSPTKTVGGLLANTADKNTKKTDKNDKNKKQNGPPKVTDTKQPAPPQNLLGLGSINIPNTLEVLTPVLSAMAGYINKNLKSTRRYDVNTTITQPKNPVIPPVFEQQKNVGPDISNRSPVYIPVGGIVGDDFEIAESQNIATFDWNDSVRPETLSKLKHEASLLNDGIPISPGEIITANSDVIVGKPGRVGPRLPSAIPIRSSENLNNVPIDMKPPPPPRKKHAWKSHNNNINSRPQIPLVNDNLQSATNIVHAPNSDDYVGPPPPQKQSLEKFQGDKRKHIPLENTNNDHNSFQPYQQFTENQRFKNVLSLGTNSNKNGVGSDVYAAQYSGETPPPYSVNQIILPYQSEIDKQAQNLQETINENYYSNSQKQNSYRPAYVPQQKPIIAPSVPLVLPEVVERSTGQPLLVKLQPSQVAFVNIPFNRTTALIYGGSTEIHHNGQYFDDPSPYPQPEFSAVENFNNGVPHFASVHPNTPHLTGTNQKQVSGVIKVSPTNSQVIQQEPDTSGNQKVPLSIIPTKPKAPNQDGLVNFVNPNVNINVPPLSFGLSEQNGDINAHIINHGTITVPIPSVPVSIQNGSNEFSVNSFGNQLNISFNNILSKPNVYNDDHNFGSIPLTGENILVENNKHINSGNHVQVHPPSTYYPKIQSYPKEPSIDMTPPPYQKVKPNTELKPIRLGNLKPKPPQQPKRNYPRPRPRPIPGISEFITPPPIDKYTVSKRPFGNRYVPGKNPVLIPLMPVTPHNNPQHVHNHKPTTFNVPRDPSFGQNNYFEKPPINIVNFNKYHSENIYKDVLQNDNDDLDLPDDHLEDDLPNEDGEVIQESNTRPLKPGEIPIEILRKKESTTTEKTSDFVRFPDRKPVGVNVRFPYDKYERPQYIDFNRKPTENSIPPNNANTFEKPQVYDDHSVRPLNDISAFKNQNNGMFGNKMPQITTSTIKTIPFINFDQHQTQTEENTLHIGPAIMNHPPITYPTPSIVETTTYKEEISSQSQITMKNIIKTTTQKPILIFIDENASSKDDFFHKKHVEENRPKVTSLPIDTYTPMEPVLVTAPTFSNANNFSQTETPFDGSKYSGMLPTNEVNILTAHETDIAKNTEPNKTNSFNTTRIPSKPLINLNSSEKLPIDIANLTQQINNMKVMYPSPNTQDILVPSLVMQPPKEDRNASSKNVFNTTHMSIESEGNIEEKSTRKPLVPVPSEEILPPPPEIPIRQESTVPTTEIVFGMSPPPLKSTHRPSIVPLPIRPINPNSFDDKKYPGITPTTIQNDHHNPNPPYRRPPSYRRPITSRPATTTAPPRITTYKGNFKRPKIPPTRPVNVPVYQNEVNEKTTSKIPLFENNWNNTVTTTESYITPSPTLETNTSVDIIVGNPDMTVVEDDIKLLQNGKIPQVDKQSSESPEIIIDTTLKTTTSTTTEATPELITVPLDLGDIVTKPVHHAGNEVKVIDDFETSIDNLQPSYSKDTRPSLVPTRYITHTKTHTVTITKTTVVKTLGGPPSTLTVLVTKTEKSFLVDTITEIHTLVKPTSIVETVTTTVQKDHSLYSPDVYYSNYPKIHLRPDLKPITDKTNVEIVTHISSSSDSHEAEEDDSLEDFIITGGDEISEDTPNKNQYNNNDSIFVVMTDKNKGGVVKIPPVIQNPANTSSNEEQSIEDLPERDEITDNEVNNILLGGILIANHPEVNSPDIQEKDKDKCLPECKASRNELCQKIENTMRCVCRPGFARMFPDRPCNPTYTYSLNVTLDKIGQTLLKYNDKLGLENSTEFVVLARKTHEALDRMVMQSDLRDIYHGVHVMSFYPNADSENDAGIVSQFYLQLSDNINENRMEDIFKKYLRGNNYSLGGTDLISSTKALEQLKVQDFNECDHAQFHDCSENAQCFNLKGSYTCSCKEGFSDLSENMLYPGRICSAEQVGCELCNYHGTCYSRDTDDIMCECFHWYAGEFCQLNLKIILIGLFTLGLVLFALLLICIILTCVRRKPINRGVTGTTGFLPQTNRDGTLDRRAMIDDTSSEDSRSEANTLPPYVQQKVPVLKPPPIKGALKKVSKISTASIEHGEPSVIFPDQKDRSLTVMIPRAKYHPPPPTSPLINYTTFDASKPSVPAINNEAKLLSYLDAGPNTTKSLLHVDSKRKPSNSASESMIEENTTRKTSGALVSAGFEVSATVVNNMGTLGISALSIKIIGYLTHNFTGTTCGTEADRSENATLIHKISADMISRVDTSSQFNTLRKSLVDDDLESNNWLDIPRISTVSESRSYDETTIPPPMKSFRSDYDTKSLQHQNDEANTMAERDLGSTFLLPHTHLYKPERGSDISGFESL
ncbi:uncharacterized protein LOC143199309 isoform X1 [Rhynchophorus ferrugineus]|uniref:uncharacterized protein LOC143199309 isoform X1 n=1 Tax=Rhynchophorus ferrugineus TaxID=354439 RepID=UPI003FCEB6B4